MNRHQRRAFAAQKKDISALRTAAEGLFKGSGMKNADPSRRYLLVKIRAMRATDLVPGYSYEPGFSLLEIEEPAPIGGTGYILQIPIGLPPEFQAPTQANAHAAFSIAYATDPEAKELIDQMRSRVRPWSEVASARGQPREFLGPIVYPPSDPPPPMPSGEVSSSRH